MLDAGNVVDITITTRAVLLNAMLPVLIRRIKMSDLLRIDHINSLPQPFMVTFCGGDKWLLYDIGVGTGLLRIDVCGKLQIMHIGEVLEFTDCDGGVHDPDTFYCDYVPN